MEDLASSTSFSNVNQAAVIALSPSPLGSFIRLPPEIRLLIYEYSRGDIYTDEAFKSPDIKVADAHLYKCECCNRHIPKTGMAHENFITQLIETREASRSQAFNTYFNLTRVNKTIRGESLHIFRKHYRAQVREARQVYYICRINAPTPCGQPRTPREHSPTTQYQLIAQDLWLPKCLDPCQLAELRMPKLTLAFCNGGLIGELRREFDRPKAAPQSLRIHIEEATTVENESEFFKTRFAWTKPIEDTRIIGRNCCSLWTFQADSKLSLVRKDDNDAVPFILDPTLTGILKYEPFEQDKFLIWDPWAADRAQKEFNQERDRFLKDRKIKLEYFKSHVQQSNRRQGFHWAG